MATTEEIINVQPIGEADKSDLSSITPEENEILLVNPEFVGGKLLETTASGDIVESSTTYQEELVSGTNIKTVNSQSLLGSGNIEIQAGAPTDDVTVNTNSDDELQAIGVIDSQDSSTPLKTWTGTKAQYDAIATKDSNTLYNITDDTDITLTLLNSLYPVGAIYIGTMSSCPLQTIGVGIWQLKASDMVLQGAGTRGSVGTTLTESLPNIKGEASWYYHQDNASTTGAIYFGSADYTGKLQGSAGGTTAVRFNIDASRSSSTYQDNAPVQQDAYLVKIWERIA
mgnify:CR=1 FL=1